MSRTPHPPFTHHPAPAQRRSSALVAVGIGVGLTALIVIAALLFGLVATIRNPLGETHEILANSYGTFQVTETGTHHLYLEQDGSPSFVEPRLTLTGPNEQHITPRPGQLRTYHIKNRHGIQIADFDAATPGLYVLQSTGAPSGTRIVITRGGAGGLIVRVFGLIGAGFLLLVGVVLAIVGGMRPRRPRPVAPHSAIGSPTGPAGPFSGTIAPHNGPAGLGHRPVPHVSPGVAPHGARGAPVRAPVATHPAPVTLHTPASPYRAPAPIPGLQGRFTAR